MQNVTQGEKVSFPRIFLQTASYLNPPFLVPSTLCQKVGFNNQNNPKDTLNWEKIKGFWQCL